MEYFVSPHPVRRPGRQAFAIKKFNSHHDMPKIILYQAAPDRYCIPLFSIRATGN
jgi:hypothetical protein